MKNLKRCTILTDDGVSYADGTSDNMRTDWILWQQACEQMKAGILNELRAHHRFNAVTSQ